MSDDVVAEREYRTADGGRIIVQFLKPRPDRGNWACDVVFSGAYEKRMAISGVDSVQALYLSLQFAATQLYTREPSVHWFESDDDLGLPTVPAIDALRLKRERVEDCS